MKIKMNREKLGAALQAVGNIVPTRHMRPILQNFKLEPVEGKGPVELELSATDLEVGIRCRMLPDTVESPKAIVLPVQVLIGIVRESRGEEISIEVDGSEATVEVGGGRFSLVLACEEDYPEVPRFSDAKEEILSMPVGELVTLIQRTVFAVATEPGRYAINGVLLQVQGKDINMVATDGRRLAHARRKLEKASKIETSVIVPPKMLREIEKVAATVEEKSEVRLALFSNQLLASIGSTTLVGRLVEGNYPKWQDVIPKEVGKIIKIVREDFLSSLRQAQLLTSMESQAVTLYVSQKRVKIGSRTPERGAADVEMEVAYEGEEIRVAFNPAFLIDVLRVLPAEEITLELGGAKRPGVIRDGDRYTYVMMPVTVRE